MNRRFHDFERDGWSDPSVVLGYETGFGRLTVNVIPALLDAAKVAAGTRLLDVATGPGYVAAAAAERDADVTGIDFADGMIAAARQLHPGIEFRIGDALALDLEDASFDAVTINFGLLHFAAPALALQEAYRVLKPGGRLATTVWAGPSRAIGFGIALQAVERNGNPHVELPPGPSFFGLSEHPAFRDALQAAGFGEVEVRDFDQGWALDSAEDLIAAFEDGTARTGALLRHQHPDDLTAIHAAMRRACEAYVQPGGTLLLPMPAVLASGVKV